MAAQDQHLGVATCAGSTCHAATQPFPGHNIRQDEYFVWQRKDSHAQAYSTLLTSRSQKIASNLGWGNAAKASGCLDCHADNVPARARGSRFQLSDGVGCEACHGGAERWIEPHVQGFKSTQDAAAHGMYPTWDPQQRAVMCLSCHQGDAQRPMTHAIMAAGHPPLLFELDTFTTLEPAHFQVTADYSKRKGTPDPARNWLIGQAMSADLRLRNLQQMKQIGLFPELAYFDCNACHHSMFASRVSAARTAGQMPGTVPLADSSLLMLSHWLAHSDTKLAARWDQGRSQLYAAVAHGDLDELHSHAQSLRALLGSEIIPRATQTKLNQNDILLLIREIVRQDIHDLSGDFSHAEQTAMAVSVLVTGLNQRSHAAVTPRLQRAVDALYASVKDRDRYQPATYRTAVQQVSAVLSAAAAD